MPVSHNYKLIFVHIPKTGGSSIERALGIYGTQNAGDNRQIDETMLFGKGLQHLTMLEISKRFGTNLTDRYFKFTFVRNPWDRALSEYRWRRTWDEQLRDLSFNEFVHYELSNLNKYKHYWPQSMFVADATFGDKPRILVDYIGHFESIDEDFQELVNTCGLPKLTLPHINKAKSNVFAKLSSTLRKLAIRRSGIQNSHHCHTYRSEYDDKTRELIAELYHKDIELFGYTF